MNERFFAEVRKSNEYDEYSSAFKSTDDANGWRRWVETQHNSQPVSPFRWPSPRDQLEGQRQISEDILQEYRPYVYSFLCSLLILPPSPSSLLLDLSLFISDFLYLHLSSTVHFSCNACLFQSATFGHMSMTSVSDSHVRHLI